MNFLHHRISKESDKLRNKLHLYSNIHFNIWNRFFLNLRKHRANAPEISIHESPILYKESLQKLLEYLIGKVISYELSIHVVRCSLRPEV